MNFKKLKTEINKGNIYPVYLFTGKEMNIADILEKEIIKKAITPGMEMLNLTRYDEKDLDYTEVLASFETLPVMSQKRVIIIDEKAQFFNLTDKTILEQFENYLKNPSDSTVLIIRDEKPDKRKKLYKLLREHGEIVELKKLDYRDLSNWISNRLKTHQIKIKRELIDYFIERSHYLENDSMETRTLDKWLEQLIDYTGAGEEVTVEAIDEVVPAGIEEDIFKIIDMAVSGKLQGVKKELENLLEHGESPIRIFALLLYQLRNIVNINLLLQAHMNKNQIAGRLKLAPFIVNKTIPIARKYERDRVLELLVEAADLDYKMKTGQIEPGFALEYFILKMNITKKQSPL